MNELINCLPPIIGITIGMFVFIGLIHPGYFHLAKYRAWKQFATSNKLTLNPGNFFKKASVSGKFQDYNLKLDTFLKFSIVLNSTILTKGKGKRDYNPYTRIVLSINSQKQTTVSKNHSTPHDIIEMFKAAGIANIHLKGAIVARENHPGIYYEQEGIEVDEYYLQTLAEGLSSIANVYSTLLARGGVMVPALQKTLTLGADNLQPLIIQLLYDIGQETIQQMGQQPSKFLCPDCLVRFAIQEIHLPQHNIRIKYCGCRVCCQSKVYRQGRVEAILDKQMTSEQLQNGLVLQTNWLIRRKLFDFDTIKIINATNEDVERFTIQVGNDTDIVRVRRYKEMLCIVHIDCQLSENTMRILKRMFGKVKIYSNPIPNKASGKKRYITNIQS